MARELRLRHEVIDADPPGSLHDVTLLFDLNGDGRREIFIGGKSGEVFWYENPSWERHLVANVPELEAGGVVLDVNGNGRPDVVVGQQYTGNELFWFECPEDPRQEWPVRVIENRFKKYHDQAVADVDGDGRLEIVFLSQLAGILGYYDIPEDPTVEPWPEDHFHLVADGLPNDLEGLLVADIDGDSALEIVAGPDFFQPPAEPGGKWRHEKPAEEAGISLARAAVADLDGDGALDLVLAEGEKRPGRLMISSPPDWRPQVVRDDLFHPHSLEIADFDGDSRPDIFTAEMGLGENENPRMFIYLNRGGGRFEEVLFQEGIPTHEAKVADMTGNGLPDIVGKPYEPERHIDVWFNES